MPPSPLPSRPRTPLRALARRAPRVLLGTGLAAALLAGACAAGVAVTMRESFPSAPGVVPAAGWPPAAPVPEGRTVVAVVLGATGSVVGDALAPYEVFARSERFSVYTVAARREPVALSGGLRALPDRTFAEVDARTVAEPDVVVVPAVAEPRGEREAPLREWVARQAARGARILGVCAGSDLLAAAGVLDGRRATSFWQRIDALRGSDPQVRWVRGLRYVQDGPVTTTAGVTSGIVGALRLVEQLAGTAEAERVGREAAYPGWSAGGPPEIPVNRPAPADLPYVLNAAFPWGRPSVGVGLAEGVGEIDVAAAFEVYSGTSFAARTVPVAAGPVVRTRHGVLLLAEPAGPGAAPVDRLVVPGARHAGEAGPALTAWAAGRGLEMVLPHRDRAAGESGFDGVLRDLAARADLATARATAKFTEYPVGHLELAGPAWPWRPTALGALALAAAVGGGVLAGKRRMNTLIVVGSRMFKPRR
ncbi:DJ-1/PfpI family protein [Planomonospora sp. ID91781]|uniref:DJ-1/PfpI family protein n=1 Tax=Planomonospora sp. ID91781 TaxID=2738135 RepID=UPI0018C3ECA2|nr:DJ-1/PfpI family protein [Planomonospora sp. ID91781]MBG0824568.1 DJ-1/PfpI family protein [Planomonospora sp. ID91781]